MLLTPLSRDNVTYIGLLVLGLLSATECWAAILADWHDGDDTNVVLGANGRSLVQLLFRFPSGVFLWTMIFMDHFNGLCTYSLQWLWCCWLGGRKGTWSVKSWVVRYSHGYLSGARCKWFAYGPADATATPSSLASVKSRMVDLSGAGLPRLSWKEGH